MQIVFHFFSFLFIIFWFSARGGMSIVGNSSYFLSISFLSKESKGPYLFFLYKKNYNKNDP